MKKVDITFLPSVKDNYFDELVNHPMTVTNFRGIYNDHISHHIMAMVLSFSKSLNLYIHQQSKRLWNPIKSENGSTRYMPEMKIIIIGLGGICLLYTSPSPRDATLSRMPSSA